jgi:KDO2-lipid IV(A) lauroyltransferase
MDQRAQQPGRSYRHRYEGPFFRRLFLGGVKYMPEVAKRLTMPLWAGLFWGLVGGARRTAEQNLDQVLGPASPLLRKLRGYRLFLNYAHMLTDNYAFHLGVDSDVEAISVGRQNMLGSLARGRGVIAVTGHLGMWQFGSLLAEWNDLPTFHMAMAEEPNPLVQQFEERFRSRFRIIYTTGSPFASLELLSVLRRGAILGIQMDRHLGGQAVPVPFCGRTAWFAAGPATLGRLSGAPLVPLFFVVEPHPLGRHKRILHYIEEPIEVPHTRDRQADIIEATRRLVAVYERYVRRYPDQWYNFHDLWSPPQQQDDPQPGHGNAA